MSNQTKAATEANGATEATDTKEQQRSSLVEATKSFLAAGGKVKKTASGKKKPASGKKEPAKGKKEPAKGKETTTGAKKRPALVSWSMLRIKEGTKLECTLSPDVYLVTRSWVTTEVELYYRGKSKGRFLGTQKAEEAVRNLVKKPIKGRPQGWNIFILKDSPKKGQSESIFKRYDRLISIA